MIFRPDAAATQVFSAIIVGVADRESTFLRGLIIVDLFTTDNIFSSSFELASYRTCRLKTSRVCFSEY